MKKAKKIIIYGGAFNPPTKAHAAILQALVHEAQRTNSEIWVIPSGERPDKTIDITNDTRIALCAALIKSVESHNITIKIIDFELAASTETNTLKSSQNLQKKYPNFTFTWVFGSDSIKTMRTWPGGNELYASLHMLVVTRPGIHLTSLPPHARHMEVQLSPMSSTEVRDRLKNGHSVHHLTPEHVTKLLKQTSLY